MKALLHKRETYKAEFRVRMSKMKASMDLILIHVLVLHVGQTLISVY
jgi:hypothetical protein